jgi:hypothetical protein
MSATTRVIVRYKVKAGHVRENEELVRAVYQELEQTQPAGLRYSTFKLDDGHTFIHLAETEDGHRPLPELEAFQRFQASIQERCDEPPTAGRLERIGSFRSPDD